MDFLRPVFHNLTDRLANRRALILFLSLLSIVLAADSAKILKGSKAFFRSRSDFEDYFEAARRIRSGQDLYLADQMDRVFREAPKISSMTPEQITALLQQLKGVGAYLYPPFFAWSLGPFTYLDYRAAAILFQSLALLALLGSLVFLYKTIRPLNDGGTRDQGALAVLSATLLYSSFLDDNASNGNAGFLLLAMLVVGVLLCFRSEKEDWQSFLGGFLIGLAAAIKIIPGFVAGVLLTGRRWRGLAGFVGGLLFAFLGPALTLGWGADVNLHGDWYSFLIQNYGRFSVVRPYANNQTISAALSKLFVGGSDLKQAAYGLPLEISGDRLPIVSTAIRLINLLLIGVLGIALALKAWRNPVRSLSDVSLSRLLSLTMLTALVTSGVSWYHTYAIMILPLALRLSLPVPFNRTDRFAFFAPAAMSLIILLLPRILVEAISLYSFFTWVVLSSVMLLHFQAWKGLLRQSDF